jgi:hypothetical protein
MVPATPLRTTVRRFIWAGRLPRDVERYRDVDIPLGPENGNANHTGDSYRRAPLARLRP